VPSDELWTKEVMEQVSTMNVLVKVSDRYKSNNVSVMELGVGISKQDKRMILA